MKVALYIRVSTERQANEGDSLEEQEKELKKFCDFRNFDIHNLYIERGKSGGNTKRPEYQKLIKDIEQRKIQAVVVKKLDRLSRSLMDFENLMNLMNENQVEFISIKENFDTTTAMGKAMLRVALVFAQLEREQTSERIADVMGHRASLGLFNGGNRPLGYSVINKELVPYNKEKKIIELIFQTFLENHSTTTTANVLNDLGLRDQKNNLFTTRQIHWILQNQIYAGKISWNRVLYEGVHQPIISDQTFQKVETIFKESTFVRAKSKTNTLLAKKIFCSLCGSPLTPSHAVNRYKTKYFYYRCTSSKSKNKTCQQHFACEQLDNRVIQILIGLSMDTEFNKLENKLLKHNEAIMTKINEQEKSQQKSENNLYQLKTKHDKYLDTLLSSQFLSQEREFINAKLSELEEDEKQLKTTINKQLFCISKTKEELINISEIKQLLINYRSGSPYNDSYQHKLRLSKLIDKIIVSSDTLLISFVFLPLEMEFELSP
jgi:site-specific DNA recombinase